MKNWVTAASLGMVLSAPMTGRAETADSNQAEIEQLKGMVATLLARVEQLERAQTPAPETAGASLPQIEERLTAVEESNDRQTDQLAQGLANSTAMDWARNIKLKGDFRYRNEQFDIEGVSSDRVRDRIRARLGVEAKINSNVLVGFELATADILDPRSTNSTLDDDNARKAIGVNLAYVDWRPRDGMLFTAGKQKQPWIKAGYSFLFDGDVNPEGLSFQYGGKTGAFAKAWGFWLNEDGGGADTNVLGGQLGYAFSGGLTVAAALWDYGALKDSPVLPFTGAPAGNSSYTANATCTTPSPTGATRCYTYDYNIVAGDVQWSGRVGAMPIMLFGQYMENTAPDDLNQAYNVGFLLGKASDPHTWEFGALYGKVERDAQFAALVDSDFADGLTQGRGYVLQGSWAPVKNMTMKATYFINDRNYDTAAEVDYKRLQLDLNYKF